MPLYRFNGSTAPNDVALLVIESDRNGAPEKALGVGQVGEMEESEYELHKAAGLKLSKVESVDEKDELGAGFEYLRPEGQEDAAAEEKPLDADDPKKGKGDGNAPAPDANKPDPKVVAREGGAVSVGTQDK